LTATKLLSVSKWWLVPESPTVSSTERRLVAELFPDYPTTSQVAALLNTTEEEVERLARQRRLSYLESDGDKRFIPERVRRLAPSIRAQHGME
jgi:hypothetical protein